MNSRSVKPPAPTAPLKGLRLALLLASATVAFGTSSGGQPERWWSSLGVRDLDGGDVPLAGKWLVLVFLDTDCPVSNACVPVLNGLARDFAAQGVRFVGVYSEPESEIPRMRRHARDFSLGFPTTCDHSHRLMQIAGATYSSEVAVFGASGTLLYRGRIDNQVGDDGAARPRATRHDLRLVLNRLGAGETGPFPGQPGFGCPLPDRDASP